MTAQPATDEPIPTLADGISRIMRVYMALADIRHQKEIGERLGWNESKTTRKFQGRWDLKDLADLSRLTRLSASDLVGDPDQAIAKLQSMNFARLVLVRPGSEQMELSFLPTPTLTPLPTRI